jgi:hypothetical protein
VRAVCSICRKPVTPANGTMMQAFGKPLFLVHNGADGERCKEYVTGGMRLLGQAAFTGFKLMLKKNAPTALKLVESVTTLRGQHNDSR